MSLFVLCGFYGIVIGGIPLSSHAIQHYSFIDGTNNNSIDDTFVPITFIRGKTAIVGLIFGPKYWLVSHFSPK